MRLTGNRIGGKGAVMISKALNINTTLAELNLGGDRMKNEIKEIKRKRKRKKEEKKN